MKLLFGMKMKAVVLGIVVVSMGMSVGSGSNANGFHVLGEVLRRAERVMNETDTHSGPLKEALYGMPDRHSFSVWDPVTMKSDCRTMRLRNLLCTYNSVTSGCFAESVAGSLTCTLEKWNGHFQNAGNQARDKCLLGSDNMEGTHKDSMRSLEEAVKEVRYTVEKGSMHGRTLFYLGEGMGLNGCSGSRRNDACAGCHGVGKTRDNVPIPWLDAIKKVIPDLRKAPPRDAIPPKTTAPTARTSPTLKGPEALKNPDPPRALRHPHSNGHHSKGAYGRNPHTRYSITKIPTQVIEHLPEDTSTTDEPGILDPTAAPFSLPEGADILTPLWLFPCPPLALYTNETLPCMKTGGFGRGSYLATCTAPRVRQLPVRVLAWWSATQRSGRQGS
ncbi:unnamed protein product [Trypanosoma congolense IL3000]|uniref:WGS project CAEQ00000000 data, annotated contig 1264 n=1 Tax=Trypanosoma congolense (strain IL3000) TaxID=1068625 RepID=F9W518_TRYCI|nr:unnamed protein product [Trypanosoma congolense IL3000]